MLSQPVDRSPGGLDVIQCLLGQGGVLELRVGAIFEELVMPGVENDQIRLVVQYFFQDRYKPVTGVRDATTVNDFPGSLWCCGLQAQFKPTTKGSL